MSRAQKRTVISKLQNRITRYANAMANSTTEGALEMYDVLISICEKKIAIVMCEPTSNR